MSIDKLKDLDFWNRTKLNSITGCIEWQGRKNQDGYGGVDRLGYSYQAHRWIWQLYNGTIPNNLYVLHKCDNPCCVNLEHLFLGTQKVNVQDCIQKERFKFNFPKDQKGELNRQAVLTTEKVKQIRALYPLISSSNLQKLFGIKQQNVSCIIKRKSWRHILPLSEQEILSIREQWASQYT